MPITRQDLKWLAIIATWVAFFFDSTMIMWMLALTSIYLSTVEMMKCKSI